MTVPPQTAPHRAKPHFVGAHFAATLFAVVLLVLLWAVFYIAVDAPLILPSPLLVARRFFALWGGRVFRMHLGATLLRVFGAFAISVAVSLILGALQGFFPWFARFMRFPMAIIKAAPVVSFILIALFWFSTNAVPVFVSVLMTLPVLTAAVTNGILGTDKKLLAMCRVYGFTPLQTARYCYVPHLLPAFFAGAVAAFGQTWKVVVAAEVLSLPRAAAGTLMQTAKVHLETADVFAITISLIVLSYGCERLFSFLARGVLRFSRSHGANVCGAKRCGFRADDAVCGTVGSVAFGARPVSSEPAPLAVPSTAAGQAEPAVPMALQIAALSVTRGGKPLYRDFSLALPAGSVTALIAPSGAGKTTLLDVIARLLPPDSGSVTMSRVSYLFQEPRLLPALTVEENAVVPLTNLFPAEEAVARARSYLDAVLLTEKCASRPLELSGGERQRVALARAFAYPAPVLLMDEAFQSQDLALKMQLMALFEDLLAREKRTVLIVTHDIKEALTLADRVLVLTGSPLAVARDLANPVDRTTPVTTRYLAADSTAETSILGALLP